MTSVALPHKVRACSDDGEAEGLRWRRVQRWRVPIGRKSREASPSSIGCLRGEVTGPSSLQRGAIEIDPVAAVAGRAWCWRWSTGPAWGRSPSSPAGADLMQVVASMVKVPALFFLTLLVTFPSLYVFNALVGSRLTLGAVVRLLVAALGVIVAVLASLGPIVAFFSVSTTSYPFMLLFNVVVFAVSRVAGDDLPAPDAAPPERGSSRRRARRPIGADRPTNRSPRPSRRRSTRSRTGCSAGTSRRSSASGSSCSAWSGPDGLGPAAVRRATRTCRSPGSAAGESNFFQAVFRTLLNLFS